MFLGLYTIQTERKHTHNTVISPHGRSPSVMDWALFVYIAGKALSMNRKCWTCFDLDSLMLADQITNFLVIFCIVFSKNPQVVTFP